MASPSAHPPRYATLDHWRGFAALSVVVFHAFSPWLGGNAPPNFNWLAAIAEQGYLGVHLFFVISGYCIAQLVLREFRRGRNVLEFLRQRFLRIFPPYWAACLVAAALALAALPFNHAVLFATPTAPGALPSSINALLGHTFLLDQFLGRPGYLLVAWTLTWELSYYLLAALLLGLALRLGAVAGLSCAFLLAAVGAFPAATARLPSLSGWSEFMCGACVLFALDSASSRRTAWPWLAAIASLGLVGAATTAPHATLPFSAAFALALFYLYRLDARLASARAFSWLSPIGAMSFSLYLVHVPVASAVRNLLSRVFPHTDSTFSIPIILAILASLAAAQIFYRCVERPSETWRKSLLRPNPPVPSPSVL